jgi:hypothetical protein
VARPELPITATSPSDAWAEACPTSSNVTAGGEPNTHGHKHRGMPEARTTTVMRSMHSRAPTHGCPELGHRVPRSARGLCAPGAGRVPPTEGSRAARPPLTGEGGEAVPVARLLGPLAGICGDEAADGTFP